MSNPYSLLDFLPKVNFTANTIVPNLCIRFSIIEKVKKSSALFSYIQIKDRQRPEDIAYENYGSEDLYWIVMLMNDMVDPFYDWILSDTELLTYTQNKYGIDNVWSVHHYETTDFSELDKGTWVSEGTPFSIPISNWTYESTLNESKRRIKILNPAVVPQVLIELKKEIVSIRNQIK